jgi:5'(3')-deoxyribonucleotidase
MIKTIFLDVDGVLVNFRKGIHDAFVKPYHYPTLSKKWKFWDDWPEVTFEMVNAVCTIGFWQNLEWMHDGHDILRVIFDKFSASQIYLLTTPMPNIESPTGKWLWVHDQIPAYIKRTIITQAPKFLLARPDTLLIDDKDQNIDEFVEAGGRGCLVPRPWNCAHFCTNQTIEVVKDFLENLE